MLHHGKTNIRSCITYTVEINRTRVEVISRFAEGRIKEGIFFSTEKHGKAAFSWSWHPLSL